MAGGHACSGGRQAKLGIARPRLGSAAELISRRRDTDPLKELSFGISGAINHGRPRRRDSADQNIASSPLLLCLCPLLSILENNRGVWVVAGCARSSARPQALPILIETASPIDGALGDPYLPGSLFAYRPNPVGQRRWRTRSREAESLWSKRVEKPFYPVRIRRGVE